MQAGAQDYRGVPMPWALLSLSINRCLWRSTMYVCLCTGIREAEFQDMVTRHSGSLEAVKHAMGLDEFCCGRCEAQLEELIGHLMPVMWR